MDLLVVADKNLGEPVGSFGREDTGGARRMGGRGTGRVP